MTVTRTGPPSTPVGDDPGNRAPGSGRWLYVAVLLLVGLVAVAAVIAWPLYGTAAAVFVAIVIAIVHVCRN